MRLSFILHAPLHSVFTPGCFDQQINQEVDVRKDVGGSYSGTLVAAEVSEDGLSARLTMEVDAPEITEMLRKPFIGSVETR